MMHLYLRFHPNVLGVRAESCKIELEAMIEIVDAFIRKGNVFIPNATGLFELRERGFGDLKGRKLVLSPYEAFYLIEKGKIQVREKGGKRLELRDLVERFSAGRPEIWIKYLVYRDLRDRGYIVRETKRVHFEVHGKGAVRRLIYIIYEGAEASLKVLRSLLRFAVQQKRDLILAVVDRRTDIVYYSLSTLKI
jgi:tRNA-intron endonuclease